MLFVGSTPCNELIDSLILISFVWDHVDPSGLSLFSSFYPQIFILVRFCSALSIVLHLFPFCRLERAPFVVRIVWWMFRIVCLVVHCHSFSFLSVDVLRLALTCNFVIKQKGVPFILTVRLVALTVWSFGTHSFSSASSPRLLQPFFNSFASFLLSYSRSQLSAIRCSFFVFVLSTTCAVQRIVQTIR